jgi:ribonuclease HII
MASVKRGRNSRPLFKFDLPYRDRHGLLAGVDEVGRGPLAGPVVSAAVILPPDCKLPYLNDSKLLSAERRWELYRLIQRFAWAIGVGIVEHDEVDRLNIYWASFHSMRLALGRLMIRPAHVLVDGFRIPQGPESQTGIIEGDRKSASIAAAAIIAKVTRDCLMEAHDRRYPGYGFKQHKGYGTAMHLQNLQTLGPCPIHRRSFSPVRLRLVQVDIDA